MLHRILHTIEHALVIARLDDQRLLHLGPDIAGNMLEVVTLAIDDEVYLVIHAMKMRPKYRTQLRGLGSPMPDKKTYGTTKDGKPITDELIEEYVAEAERGYDLDKLKVVRGRPPMGSAPAKPFPVRLDPELRGALDKRAEHDGRPASEIVREALRQYLSA
jgi:hypothetical protein